VPSPCILRVGGSNVRRFEAKPVTNMTIIGNYFGRTEGVPVSVHNVDGLKIQGNSIDWTPRATPAERPDWLSLQDCDNISIQGNHTLGVAAGGRGTAEASKSAPVKR